MKKIWSIWLIWSICWSSDNEHFILILFCKFLWQYCRFCIQQKLWYRMRQFFHYVKFGIIINCYGCWRKVIRLSVRIACLFARDSVTCQSIGGYVKRTWSSTCRHSDRNNVLQILMKFVMSIEIVYLFYYFAGIPWYNLNV